MCPRIVLVVAVRLVGVILVRVRQRNLPSDSILINVTEVLVLETHCRAETKGTLESRKRVHAGAAIPTEVPLPTAKDLEYRGNKCPDDIVRSS